MPDTATFIDIFLHDLPRLQLVSPTTMLSTIEPRRPKSDFHERFTLRKSPVRDARQNTKERRCGACMTASSSSCPYLTPVRLLVESRGLNWALKFGIF